MIRYIVILLSILLRCTVYVWWCMVYATQKGWVVKKKKVRRGCPGKKVCRGGSGGVPPPAKRRQKPNRFSGRGFITNSNRAACHLIGVYNFSRAGLEAWLGVHVTIVRSLFLTQAPKGRNERDKMQYIKAIQPIFKEELFMHICRRPY